MVLLGSVRSFATSCVQSWRASHSRCQPLQLQICSLQPHQHQHETAAATICRTSRRMTGTTGALAMTPAHPFGWVTQLLSRRDSYCHAASQGHQLHWLCKTPLHDSIRAATCHARPLINTAEVPALRLCHLAADRAHSQQPV